MAEVPVFHMLDGCRVVGGSPLADLIERARNHVMTPEEVFEQRVSFVYGMQDFDGPTRSKDEIRAALIKLYGRPKEDTSNA